MTNKKRIFATSRIGDPAENRLRERGYELSHARNLGALGVRR
jgi:hypothetical protein